MPFSILFVLSHHRSHECADLPESIKFMRWWLKTVQLTPTILESLIELSIQGVFIFFTTTRLQNEKKFQEVLYRSPFVWTKFHEISQFNNSSIFLCIRVEQGRKKQGGLFFSSLFNRRDCLTAFLPNEVLHNEITVNNVMKTNYIPSVLHNLYALVFFCGFYP